MGLFIIHEVLRDKKGKEILRFTESEPLDLNDKSMYCRIDMINLYNMYLSIHRLSPYRFSYDRFISDKNLEYKIYEIKNTSIMDDNVFYKAILDLGISRDNWYSDGKAFIDKPFSERKRICESFVAYTIHTVSKDLELIESMDSVGNRNYLSWRTNIDENYKRKYKAGDRVIYGNPSTVVNLGPDDSIPYSCVAWSERYCLIQDDDVYRDWIPESELISCKGEN